MDRRTLVIALHLAAIFQIGCGGGSNSRDGIDEDARCATPCGTGQICSSRTCVAADCITYSALCPALDPATSFRLGVISDPHLAETDASPTQFNVAWVQDAAAQLATWNPHLLVILGDLVHDRPTDYATQLGYVLGAYDIAGIPRALVVGNHDLEDGPTADAVRAAWPPDVQAQLVDGKLYGSFDVAGIHFVVLDAMYAAQEPATRSATTKAGYVPQEELDWLAADLAATPNPTVVLHHQALGTWYPDGASQILNATAVMALLESSHKIVASLSGHIHRDAQEIVNGVNYFTVNSIAYPNATITTHDEGGHVEVMIDTAHRLIRYGIWENDSIIGYREVRVYTLPY